MNNADIFKVLSNNVRLNIVRALYEHGELNVSSIQEKISEKQTTVSQHIGKLSNLKIVDDRREGTRIYYSLSNGLVRQICKVLNQDERMMS